jgi:hypothetical protein
MIKNKLFLGMLAAMLTFGLVLTGCPTGGGTDPVTEAEIDSVSAANGTISIVLVAEPTDAPN